MSRENFQNNTQVIIIGGGPTGLSLGLGLARQGIRSVILEKKDNISRHSKAPVVHQRTREIFRQWGIEDEFLDQGNLVRELTVWKAPSTKTLFNLEFSHLEKEAQDPGMLILEQNKTERLLLEAIRKSGLCKILFGREAVKLEQNTEGVKVWTTSEDGEEVFRGHFVTGCDGASSFVREHLQLPFEGKTYNVHTFLADVKPGDVRNKLPWPRLYNGKRELTVGIKIARDLWRLIHLQTGKDAKKATENDVTPAQVNSWIHQTVGEGPYEQVWASPFNIHRRSSPVFRKDRIILAGDAAHVHSPVGGQGMNAGIQDAHNLAWKLAAVIITRAPHNLLDSYERERKEAVVEEVSGNTDFLTNTFLQSPKVVRIIAFFVLRRVLSIPFLRDRFLRRAMMINIGYKDLSISSVQSKAGGRRLPNVLLVPEKGKAFRLYDRLPGNFEIIQLGIEKDLSVPFEVIKIDADHREPAGLLKKLVPGGKGWILVRPDMHIAWAGSKEEDLRTVIKDWNMV